MSAIFGVVHLDGAPADVDPLRRMAARLAHRGPDGGEVWTGGAVGLGHRLRQVTPESLRERQPVTHGPSGLTITADARIDNRDELIAALSLLRGAADALTDPELIVAAYRRWGERCPEHLIGDFAFAVWDARARTLFCARDPFGVRPLYYHASPRLFAFASEPKALLALPDVPRRLNELQVAYYLEAFLEDPEVTFYDGLLRLPAAHCLRVDSRGAGKPARYWRLDAGRRIRLRDDREYAEAFREQFDEAVRCRVRSAFPVGSTLSGGLDSSSIACTARRYVRGEAPGPLHTFSAVFPGLPEAERRLTDETEYIDAVLATGGFVAHRVEADRLAPFTGAERVLELLDEAPLGYNVYMHWALYGVAAAQGVRVFLDGIDGDSCVGHGWDRLGNLARGGAWETLGREIEAVRAQWNLPPSASRSLVRRHAVPELEAMAEGWRVGAWSRGAAALARQFGLSRRRLLVTHGLRPMFAGPVRRVRRRGPREADAPPSLLRPDFAARIDLRARQAALLAGDPAANGDAARPGLESPLFQYGLEMAERLAAAFGLEARYPFFDRRLAEFCLALPDDQRLSGGWTRVVFRRAMEGVLPPEVQWRPGKQDLTPNFRRGLRSGDRATVERFALARPHPLAAYLDEDAVRRQYNEFVSGADVERDAKDGLGLYRVAMLTRWLTGSAWERPALPAT